MPLTDLSIADLEDELVLAVQSASPDWVTAEPFPGDPQTYSLSQTAAMLVVFSPEQYDTSQTGDGSLVSLTRQPTFDIVCIHRNRRTEKRRSGHGGVYTLVDIAVQELAGEPAGGRVIVPEQTRPRGLNPRDKTWRYQVRVRLDPLSNANRQSVGGVAP